MSDLTSKTFTIIQDPLGAMASATSTIIPEIRLVLCRLHLCLSCSIGKYLEIHLFQKSLAMYCIYFYFFLMQRSFFSNSPGGMIGLLLNIRVGFGVRASKSFGSSETLVIGLLFNIVSTSQKMVWSPLSNEVRTLTTEQVRCSQIPPGWEAAGVFKFHCMPSWRRAL